MSWLEGNRSFVVAEDGLRLDRLVADALGCGRRRARELIRSGRVRVDGRRAAAAANPPSGALVSVDALPRATESVPEPEGIRVLWEGDGILAITKPAGVHTHLGRSPNSVAAWIRRRRPSMAAVGASPVECGLVHRLDRDTSGILLAAKTQEAYLRLRACFTERRVAKCYLALVAGRVTAAFRVERPLEQRGDHVAVAGRVDGALEAVTAVEPLATLARASLVSAFMKTGVRHQIRAHLAAAGHPIVGDATYGGPSSPPGTRDGQLLHAFRIVPDDGPDLCAPVPADFVRAYATLGRN